MAKISKKTQSIINDVEKIQDYVGRDIDDPEEIEKAIAIIIAKEEGTTMTEATLNDELEAVVNEAAKVVAPKKVASKKAVSEKPAAEKKLAAPKVLKEKKAPAPKKEKAPKLEINEKTGFKQLTIAIVQEALAKAEAIKSDNKKIDRAVLAEELGIGVGTIADVLSGSPYVRKMLHKAGLAHPKGEYVPYVRPAKKASKPALEAAAV